MDTEQTLLQWTADNAGTISTIIMVIVIPALIALMQRLAAWGCIKSETAKALADGIEATDAESTKKWIAATATQLDAAVKDSITRNATHADIEKPNPKGPAWLRITLSVLQRTDVLGMLAGKLKGK